MRTTSLSVEATHVSVLQPSVVSKGLTISRLRDGEYTMSAHDGESRVLITVTESELRELVGGLQGILGDGSEERQS